MNSYNTNDESNFSDLTDIEYYSNQNNSSSDNGEYISLDNFDLHKPKYKILVDNNFVNIYKKGLYSNQEILKLITALKTKNKKMLDSVKLSNHNNKLNNPTASWITKYAFTAPPTINSKEFGYEMIYLYSMSLCRDIPFSKYSTDILISSLCGDISRISFDNRKLSYSFLFGKELSYFLVDEKVQYDTRDYMITLDNALSCQKGKVLEKKSFNSSKRNIQCGRDLALYVANKDVYDVYHEVIQLIKDAKCEQKHKNEIETQDISFDIFHTMVMIRKNVLAAVWNVKWNIFYPLPEEIGIEIEKTYLSGDNIYNFSNDLLKNPVLSKVREKNSTNLLSQVFNSGAPLNPSNPCEKAALAAAFTLIIKVFFNLEKYIHHEGKKSTIEIELNKLISNISMANCWAGINYKMDIDNGIQIGENIAIEYLKSMDIKDEIIGYYGQIITI